MKLLIFHSENGQECNSYNLIETQEDLDKAALSYLQDIGNFGWDEDTNKLQELVDEKKFKGLFTEFRYLASSGYDCFRLDTTYNISLVEFDKF